MVWITNAFIRVFALIEASTCVVNWVYLPTIGSFSFSEPGFAVKDWGACFVYGTAANWRGYILWLSEMTPSSCTIENNGATNKTTTLRLLEPTLWLSLSVKARQMAEKFTWTAYLDQIEESLYDCWNGSARLSVPAESHFSHMAAAKERSAL